MPIPLMLLRRWPLVSNVRTASSMHVSTEDTSSRGSCSCHLVQEKSVRASSRVMLFVDIKVLIPYPGLG